MTRKNPRKARARPIRSQRTARGSVSGPVRAAPAADSVRRLPAPCMLVRLLGPQEAAAPPGEEVDQEEEPEGDREEDEGDGRRSRVVVLLQLDHDEERGDLRAHR